MFFFDLLQIQSNSILKLNYNLYLDNICNHFWNYRFDLFKLRSTRENYVSSKFPILDLNSDKSITDVWLASK